MIRLLLILAIWIAIVGGLLLFTGTGQPDSNASSTATIGAVAESPHGRVVLELTTTFEIAPDRFALENPEPALVVRLNGEEIFRAAETFPAGRPILVDRDLPLREGPNELLLRATPGPEAADRSSALRARLTWRGRTLFEKTAWSEPGQRLVTAFSFDFDGTSGREPGDEH